MKLEFDAGTQTRLLNFDRTAVPPAERTWQGFSLAEWEGPGVGRGACERRHASPAAACWIAACRAAAARACAAVHRLAASRRSTAAGSLKVVTTSFREGYLRKNGVPYSESATITEYFHRLPTHPNGDKWLHVVTIVEDPRYLTRAVLHEHEFPPRGERRQVQADAVPDRAAAAMT